jgi:hypothetical protein
MQTRKSIEQRKAACEGVLLDEDPIQRPEDSMDYIQDPVCQNSPQFSDGCRSVQARLQGTSGAESHPKSYGVKTEPRVAKSSPASKIALSVRPAKSRVDPPKSEIPCWCKSDSTQRIRERDGLVPAVCGVGLTDFGFLSLECGTGSAGPPVLA